MLQVTLLYLTYGVMYGLGASLAYTPSLAILGHYFKRYLGLVNGIVTAGSSVFTTLMPYLIEVILRRFGLEGTLRFLAMLTAVVMACAILFKPIPRESYPAFYFSHSSIYISRNVFLLILIYSDLFSPAESKAFFQREFLVGILSVFFLFIRWEGEIYFYSLVGNWFYQHKWQKCK